MSVEIKVPQQRKDQQEASAERIVKLILGKTPEQAKSLVTQKITDGTLSRDQVLLGLIGAVTYLVNHAETRRWKDEP